MTHIIRASSLPGWNDCPRREAVKQFYAVITAAGYKFLPREKHIGAAIGTGVHSGAAHVLKAKRDHHAITLDDMVEISITSFRKEISEASDTGGVYYDASSPSPDTCEKQIANLSRAFSVEVLPQIQPVEMELALTVVINEDFTLSGHMDVLTESGIDDMKFGAIRRRYDSQLGAYAYMAHIAGKPVTELRVLRIPRTPIKKPQEPAEITRYDVRESAREASDLVKIIMAQFRNFLNTGDPGCFPANPSSILCSRRYCGGYCNRDWCRYGE